MDNTPYIIGWIDFVAYEGLPEGTPYGSPRSCTYENSTGYGGFPYCRSSGQQCANARWPVTSCQSANALRAVQEACVGFQSCGQYDFGPGVGTPVYLQPWSADEHLDENWGSPYKYARFWPDGPPGQTCDLMEHRMMVKATWCVLGSRVPSTPLPPAAAAAQCLAPGCCCRVPAASAS